MSSLMFHPVAFKKCFQIHFVLDKQRDLTNQFPSNDSHQNRVVVVHHLLAFSRQTLIWDELAGFLKVAKNLTLQSQG